MSAIARRSQAPLRPLDPALSAEVLDWVRELRRIWTSTGMSMNQFACLHPIDKGAVSRYLNGQRIPRDHWFLDRLLALLDDNGKPVAPDVREHLTALQLRALKTASPLAYRVRLVSDELEIAVTRRIEAERYARTLEERLAERNRRVQELIDDKGRLRSAWDADRTAMQAEYERLTREADEAGRQLRQAREQALWAEQRCQQLEDLLDRLDAPSGEHDGAGARFPVDDPQAVADQLAVLRDLGLDDQVAVLATRAAAHAPVGDARELVRLLRRMLDVGATGQALELARRADAQGRLSHFDLRRLDVQSLVTLLMILHTVNADDLVRRLATDAVSCAWRGTKDQVTDLLAVLRDAGADEQAAKLSSDSAHLQVTGRW